MAALCLVPNFLFIELLFVNGSTQPAAYILPFFIIVAPSCNGVFTTNIFSSKFALTSASNIVPDSKTSPRPRLVLLLQELLF